MLEAARIDAVAKLPGQEMGQFYLLREKEVLAVRVLAVANHALFDININGGHKV
jgi:hypothetical protein